MVMILGAISLAVTVAGVLIGIRIKKRAAGLPVFHLLKNKDGKRWY